MHEGAHGNVTKSKLVNHLCVNMLDIFGANSYMWKNRHIKLHHNFPNIIGWDSDIEKSKFVSFHPEERKTKNKGQFRFFILLLYPFFVFNWF
ncbi:fatty acid desaturase, partial [Acinetobacter baumannii]